MTFKSAFISVIGRPNVGKSTLINLITKERVSIVTPKPQTTRKNIKAIYTDDSVQMVFLDTPGIHEPKTKLGEFMVSSAKSVFQETDIVVFVTAPKRGTIIPPEDEPILEMLKNASLPKVCVINKVDFLSQEEAATYIEAYSKMVDFEKILPTSAKDSLNIDSLKQVIIDLMEEGPLYYDPDQITDQTMRQMAEDFIREKLLYLLSEEVPHALAVEVENFKEREDKKILDIDAVIYCDKESQKGIIIGKDGSKLKKVGTQARKAMEGAFDSKVNLKLWVKVKPDWRNDPRMLGSLGYKI